MQEIKRYEEALEHFAKVDAPLEAAVGSGDVLCDMERCHASMGDSPSRRASVEPQPKIP